MSDEKKNVETAADKSKEKVEQQFSIQRIYLKDLSLETPLGTGAFVVEQQPSINQDLSTEVNKINDTLYETVLKLTVTATIEDKTVFLIEVQQAGLFVITGVEQQNLVQVLNTMCPQILFPYAREAIDSTLIKATFPPLMLPPINFDAIYAQAIAEKQKQATAH